MVIPLILWAYEVGLYILPMNELFFYNFQTAPVNKVSLIFSRHTPLASANAPVTHFGL